MKRLFSLLFLLIIVAAIVGGAGYLWYRNAVFSPAPAAADSTTTVAVKTGEGLFDIAPQLEQAKMLNSTLALRLYFRLENVNPPSIAEGTYEINGGLTVDQLLDKLAEGPKKLSVRVTIPEGLRYDEISKRITKAFTEAEIEKPLFKETEFNKIAATPDDYQFSSTVQKFLDKYKPNGKTLEGFIFPDTYNIGVDASALDAINLMVDTFIKRLDQNNIDPDEFGKLKSFYEVLILASIVEREAFSAEDRRMVADIFLRRLARGEILGADATSLYPKKDWTYKLTIADLENRNDPYNTRRRVGLVPTPICNSAISAIQAVLNPKPNQYNFYISANGRNYYAVTYQEHINNTNKYLR